MMIKLNDRVSKQIEIGKPARKYGTIVEKYKSSQGITHAPITLFSIKWDNEGIRRGYTEERLQKE